MRLALLRPYKGCLLTQVTFTGRWSQLRAGSTVLVAFWDVLCDGISNYQLEQIVKLQANTTLKRFSFLSDSGRFERGVTWGGGIKDTQFFDGCQIISEGLLHVSRVITDI